MGWPRSSLGSFCTIVWESPSELLGQPNTLNHEQLNDVELSQGAGDNLCAVGQLGSRLDHIRALGLD